MAEVFRFSRLAVTGFKTFLSKKYRFLYKPQIPEKRRKNKKKRNKSAKKRRRRRRRIRGREKSTRHHQSSSISSSSGNSSDDITAVDWEKGEAQVIGVAYNWKPIWKRDGRADYRELLSFFIRFVCFINKL